MSINRKIKIPGKNIRIKSKDLKNKQKKVVDRIFKDVSFGPLLFRKLPHVLYNGETQPVPDPKVMPMVRGKLNSYYKNPKNYKHLPIVSFEGKIVYEISSLYVHEKKKGDFKSSNITEQQQSKTLINGHLMFEYNNEKRQTKYVKLKLKQVSSLLRKYRTIEELKEFVHPLVEQEKVYFTFMRNKEYLRIPINTTTNDFIDLSKKKIRPESIIDKNLLQATGDVAEKIPPTKELIQKAKSLPEIDLKRVPVGSTIPKEKKETNSSIKSYSKNYRKQGDEIPEKVKREIQLTKRKQNIVSKLKTIYNHTCQICQKQIEVNIGQYISEVHHIHPLGIHNGPDIEDNMIVLCPNEHALFDRGAITIDLKKKRVVHVNPNNPLHNKPIILKHPIAQKYVHFHNKHIYLGNKV